MRLDRTGVLGVWMAPRTREGIAGAVGPVRTPARSSPAIRRGRNVSGADAGRPSVVAGHVLQYRLRRTTRRGVGSRSGGAIGRWRGKGRVVVGGGRMVVVVRHGPNRRGLNGVGMVVEGVWQDGLDRGGREAMLLVMLRNRTRGRLARSCWRPSSGGSSPSVVQNALQVHRVCRVWVGGGIDEGRDVGLRRGMLIFFPLPWLSRVAVGTAAVERAPASFFSFFLSLFVCVCSNRISHARMMLDDRGSKCAEFGWEWYEGIR